MRALLAMIKANLKMTIRNRQAIFWNLAFPALFILIFGAVFGRDTGVDFSVGIVGADSPLKTAATQAMVGNESFTVHDTGTREQELDELQDGERDIVLDFADRQDANGLPAVELYYDETEGPNADIAINVVRQILLSVAQGESPVAISVQPVTATNISYIDFFVPGILAMALMNAGVIGLSTAFVIYRERGILRRIKVTPFPLTSFIIARIATQLIVAVAQAVILVGLGRLVFGLNLRGNILVILLAIVVGALAFLAIGFAISGFARNVESAASYANLITFPMLFLSGVFFDVDSAPGWLQPITKILPLRFLVDALREPMTRGNGLETIWLDLVVLFATFLVAMAIAVRFFRWDARAS
ncbi:MAG: ABC transporter permease [Thermomicrobiales bacterium]|nr:ABC transporter permease [Thermomicrobiales bacterium]